jgi:hypothetical protein
MQQVAALLRDRLKCDRDGPVVNWRNEELRETEEAET